MTPQEHQWIKTIIAKMGKAHLDLIAESMVLKEYLAGNISKDSGRNVYCVLSEIEQKVKKRKDAVLLVAEDVDSGLAAWMDMGLPSDTQGPDKTS